MVNSHDNNLHYSIISHQNNISFIMPNNQSRFYTWLSHCFDNTWGLKVNSPWSWNEPNANQPFRKLRTILAFVFFVDLSWQLAREISSYSSVVFITQISLSNQNMIHLEIFHWNWFHDNKLINICQLKFHS